MAANKPLLADVLAVMHGKRGKLIISETHGNADSKHEACRKCGSSKLWNLVRVKPSNTDHQDH